MKKLFVVLAAILLLVMACSSGKSDAPVTYTISGTVSGAAVSNVTITLSGSANGTATTDSSGNYSITGLANGTYTVTPSITGYDFNPINISNIVVNGANITGHNFVANITFNGVDEPSDPGGSTGTPPIISSTSTTSSSVSLVQRVQKDATLPQCVENQLTCETTSELTSQGACIYNNSTFQNECVASVRTYYKDHYHITDIQPIGCDSNDPTNQDLCHSAYLLWDQYPPPSSEMEKITYVPGENSPQPDDLIVFNHTTLHSGMKYGHVAVVVSVQGSEVTIADSNFVCKNTGGVHILDMNSWATLGWYRPIVPNVTAGPTAPTNLTAVAVSPNQINLSWTDSAGDEDGFKVYSSTDNIDYTLINTLGANTVSVNTTGWAPSVTFSFDVVAYKGVNPSVAASASATTESSDNIPITALVSRLYFASEAHNQAGNRNIAIDSNYVYFFENNYTGRGWIRKIPIGGGSISMVNQNVSYPVFIAVDSNSLYWIENDFNGTGALKKISFSDSPITTLVSGINSQYMALDTNNIYFVNTTSSGAILEKISKSGGTPTPLATNSVSIGSGIYVDSDYVYFSDSAIKKVDVNGVAVSTLGAGHITGITSDGTYLYWTDYSGGTINKMAKTGGAVTVLASGLNNPTGIATDGINVYWIEFGNPGGVKKTSVNVGGAITTFSTYGGTMGIEVYGSNVYWAELYTRDIGGFIKKAPK